MIKEAINTLLNKQDLPDEMASCVMHSIIEGAVNEVQLATFLTALRMKGESVSEITAFTNVIRGKATKVYSNKDVIDIVGTGGDSLGTFNISTTSTFVVAGAGISVAKHGGRSVSSKSGSADVLEALGVNINLSVTQTEEILQQTDMTFMFAPLFHSSMKYVAPTRQKMGIRTVFNILGPLLNPALAKYTLLGVYDEKLLEPIANVLSNLGIKRALVIHGKDGLDEATLTDKTYVCYLNNGAISRFIIDPVKLGFNLCNISDLSGADSYTNAQITLDILSGKELGPKRDIVILNSALALYIVLTDKTLEECIELAKSSINSGLALSKLQQLIKISNEESLHDIR
ncbi:MAG: anthranilate phosphoribosyltransferase [Epulopiscium sp. Nuni2H_MBin003]|nr:MAG: anthranilate phosphoribosyltransferase [Epulopiscium sp. Nuni2H_MBin003]